jgi:CDGSH-type Zn-finger protein
METDTEKGGSPSPQIVPYPNGPLLVRGEFTIVDVDVDGDPLPRARKTVALCRCGVSSIKPYCDGTHKLVHFTTDDPPAISGTE